MKKLILYIAVLFFFTSCKKIIDIKTTNAEPQMVIEANITDQLSDQQIKITKSVGYTEKNIYPTVSGATVNVTDSKGVNYVFVEREPGVYVNKMKGVPGLTYNLKVTAEGNDYTASSTMPKKVELDSVGIIKNIFFGHERKTAAAFFADPINQTNFYHFTLRVNGMISQRFYVENDRLTNGNHLRIQLFFKGNNDHDSDELNTDDKIIVGMECIDSNIFDYWFALSQQSGRGPNQGTTPSNPTSNISNGALGYFSAHTFQEIGITVP